jgi:hypothetical protein
MQALSKYNKIRRFVMLSLSKGDSTYFMLRQAQHDKKSSEFFNKANSNRVIGKFIN